MARLNQDRQKKEEPKRMRFAIDELVSRGYEITYSDNTKLKFMYANEEVTLFPYSGWHTGKSIKDGRGIEKLLNQLYHQCRYCGKLTTKPDSTCTKAP